MLPPRRRFAWISVVGCCCAVLSCTDQTVGAPVVTPPLHGEPRHVAGSPSPSTPAEIVTIDPRIARLPGARAVHVRRGRLDRGIADPPLQGNGSRGYRRVARRVRRRFGRRNTRRLRLDPRGHRLRTSRGSARRSNKGALRVALLGHPSGPCVIYSCGGTAIRPAPARTRPPTCGEPDRGLPQVGTPPRWRPHARVPITGPYQLEGGDGRRVGDGLGHRSFATRRAPSRFGTTTARLRAPGRPWRARAGRRMGLGSHVHPEIVDAVRRMDAAPGRSLDRPTDRADAPARPAGGRSVVAGCGPEGTLDRVLRDRSRLPCRPLERAHAPEDLDGPPDRGRLRRTRRSLGRGGRRRESSRASTGARAP